MPERKADARFRQDRRLAYDLIDSKLIIGPRSTLSAPSRLVIRTGGISRNAVDGETRRLRKEQSFLNVTAIRSDRTFPTHEDGVGCVRVLAAQKELADGAEDLPLLGNALQGMHTEILELDARARD